MSNYADEFRKTFDNYEILNTIGSNVWQVRMNGYNRIAVLKQVENADIYKNLKSLDIKGIPQIISVFEQNGNWYVIEDCINGDTLAERIKLQGRLTAKQVKNIVIQLCRILEPIHKANIIHRDIKPSNIIITPTDTVYLIDFGIARSISENNSDTRKLGTEFYASPEQYGFKQTDNRSDVYSIGKLMIVLLSGRESVENINKLPFSNIIKKCIQVDSDKRYKTVTGLRNTFLSRIFVVFAILFLLTLLLIVFLKYANTSKITANENSIETSAPEVTENTTYTILPETTELLTEETKETVTEISTEVSSQPQSKITTSAVIASQRENISEVSTTTQQTTENKPTQNTTPVQALPPVIEEQTEPNDIRTDSNGYALNYGFYGDESRFGTVYFGIGYGTQGTLFIECKDKDVSKQKSDFYIYLTQDEKKTITTEADENGINIDLDGNKLYIPHTANVSYIGSNKPESTYYEIILYDIDSDGQTDMLVLEEGVYNIPDTLPVYTIIHPVKVHSDLSLERCSGDISVYETYDLIEIRNHEFLTFNNVINNTVEYHTYSLNGMEVKKLN